MCVTTEVCVASVQAVFSVSYPNTHVHPLEFRPLEMGSNYPQSTLYRDQGGTSMMSFTNMQCKSFSLHTWLSTFTNLFKYSTYVFQCVGRRKKKAASDMVM